MIGLIDSRARDDRRFQASLHGMQLVGDDTVRAGAPHNRSHAAMVRMKQRRAARGC